MFHGARILVAPLNWGLGHAARCIPVIHLLKELGAVPIIGADKGPLALLREEFPGLEHVRIPGMEVRYGSGHSQVWALAKQFPAMLQQVRRERLWLEQNKESLLLDAVISDQRFGLHAPGLPSVLITHQVFPFTPFMGPFARQINRKHIGRFLRCWIPDHIQAPGLAGALSHGADLPGNARYIGPLSRFAGYAPMPFSPSFRIVAVISGPEPQRTLLEQQVLHQLETISGPHLVLTGLPETATRHVGNVRIEGHLRKEALCNALVQAELVVGRTGYSTVMDLDAIGRGALLVPTPGQPEQEYLGALHAATGRHTVQSQHAIDIGGALAHPPARHAPCKTSSALSAAMCDLADLLNKRAIRNSDLP